MIKMTDAEKLDLISKIVDLQAAAQDGEDGPEGSHYQADACLAMEAIGMIMHGGPDFRDNGAVRTYLGDAS
jgi:hypothetical protein